jgi:methylglutaconyl-CoA hydratase
VKKNLKIINHPNNVCEVQLSREEIHNAFNDELIKELTDTFITLDQSHDVNIIIISGAGKSFCAGADLNWMGSMVGYSFEENVKDSTNLSTMLETINNCSKLVIGKINGHALGGGVGLVAVCDVAISHTKAKFGFTEVKLGLVPAIISPYCIDKIGVSKARAYFLSGELFSANNALEMDLLHSVCEPEEFEDEFSKLLDKYILAGPNAQIEAKKLIKNITSLQPKDVAKYTCESISKIRISEEGQEGMKALLEKRKPNWINDEN